MSDRELINRISQIEADYEYDRDLLFSKFVKQHGENYSKEEFLKFLRRRYQVINKSHYSDDVRSGSDEDQIA